MEHAAQHAAALGPILVTHAGWLWLIPFFPLLGSAINAAFGWRMERAGHKAFVHVVAVGAMALAFLTALVAFVQLRGMAPGERFLQDTLWNLFTAGKVRADLAFALDPLSMMMVLIITFIGTLIHVFSIGYMWDDEEKAYWRFFAWLNLFVFSMLLLVMGDNFVVMFFGWEGVGLCSYGLISYYYRDREKAAAGMKAFVVNRFGDFGFLAGLFFLFWGLGGATLNFRELRDLIVVGGGAEVLLHQSVWGMGLVTVAGVLMFIGAMGKSAQLPLYVWLPDAMAGPTPVSALIHAATMVTAGVYMVARLNFVFALSPSAMAWIAVIGALTALFAASIGFFQYDIKKVLAYSTVSQLGFMFIAVGVGAYWAGAYHLLTHAFFKATLFLGSGSVILGCHHEQDMRKMGGLKEHMPITRWTYLIACWAIAGFPWASGFYSKDEILWKAFSSEHLTLFGHPTPWLGLAIYVAGIVAATGTSFYMFRSYYMTFTGKYRGGHGHGHEHGEDPHAAAAHAPAHHAAGHDALPAHAHAVAAGHDSHGGHGGGTPHESPRSITFVLVTLAAGAVLVSLIGIPKAWTHHEPILEHWLAPALTAQVPFTEKPHVLEYLFQAIGVGAGAVGWFFAMLLYKENRSTVPARLKASFQGAWQVVYDKYYVDELYDALVIKPSLAFSRLLSWFDGHVIDFIVNAAGTVTRFVANVDGAIDRYFVDGAVNAVANVTMEGGRALRRLQTGRVQTYLYGALAGGLAVILLNYLVG